MILTSIKCHRHAFIYDSTTNRHFTAGHFLMNNIGQCEDSSGIHCLVFECWAAVLNDISRPCAGGRHSMVIDQSFCRKTRRVQLIPVRQFCGPTFEVGPAYYVHLCHDCCATLQCDMASQRDRLIFALWALNQHCGVPDISHTILRHFVK